MGLVFLKPRISQDGILKLIRSGPILLPRPVTKRRKPGPIEIQGPLSCEMLAGPIHRVESFRKVY